MFLNIILILTSPINQVHEYDKYLKDKEEKSTVNRSAFHPPQNIISHMHLKDASLHNNLNLTYYNNFIRKINQNDISNHQVNNVNSFRLKSYENHYNTDIKNLNTLFPISNNSHAYNPQCFIYYDCLNSTHSPNNLVNPYYLNIFDYYYFNDILLYFKQLLTLSLMCTIQLILKNQEKFKFVLYTMRILIQKQQIICKITLKLLNI